MPAALFTLGRWTTLIPRVELDETENGKLRQVAAHYSETVRSALMCYSAQIEADRLLQKGHSAFPVSIPSFPVMPDAPLAPDGKLWYRTCKISDDAMEADSCSM